LLPPFLEEKPIREQDLKNNIEEISSLHREYYSLGEEV